MAEKKVQTSDKNVNSDLESEVSNLCPVSGLTILSKPEWTDVEFGDNYKTTFTLIGDSILHVLISGTVDIGNINDILVFTDNLIQEYFPKDHPFFLLDDISNLKYTSRNARNILTNYYENRKNLSGLIFYGASPLLRLSINLGKRILVPKYNVRIYDNYVNAIKYIQLKLSDKKGKPLESITDFVDHYSKELNEVKAFSGVSSNQDRSLISGESRICPVTNLPVLGKPEWTNVKFGEYRITFSLIGENILKLQLFGEPSLQDIKDAFLFGDNIINDVISENQGFIMINDMASFKKITKETRRYLITYYKQRKNLLGIFFYNLSPIIRVGINLSKRAGIKKIKILAVDNYSNAVKSAQKLILSSKSSILEFPGKNILDSVAINTDKNEQEISEICPVSGLKIISKPEWTDVKFGHDYNLSLKLLGDRILLALISGTTNFENINKIQLFNDKIINEVIPQGSGFILLNDISNYKHTTIEVYKHFINYYKNRKGLLGLFFYGASPLVILSIKFAIKLNVINFNAKIFKNYSEAVLAAQKLLLNDKMGFKDYSENNIPAADDGKIDDQKEWLFKDGEFSIQYKIISKNILHGVSSGFFEERHVNPSKDLHERVLTAMNLHGAPHVYILDLGNSKGTNHKVRKLYTNREYDIHKKFPIKVAIFYGVNKQLRAGLYIAKLFLPFKIHITDNYKNALSFASSYESKKNFRPQLFSPFKKGKYVNEILEHIAKIDWESDKSVGRNVRSTAHSYSDVFDAIDLIKWEIDDLLSARDNTEKKLRSAKEAAEAANIAKTEFLTNMSHELRTPLNHIIGFTELVEGGVVGDLNATQKEYLGDSLSSSKHLLSLINDILDISKVEADKMILEKGKVYLKSVLENSLKIIEEQALKQNIKVTKTIGDIPEFIIGDERKIKQILYNLLSNAIKFTPNGGEIDLKAELIEMPIPSIRISISDTGIGMTPEDCKRIFSPFEQIDGSVTRKFQGTGLGLTLARSFVDLHGGEIVVKSSGKNKGSTFIFTIPVDVR